MDNQLIEAFKSNIEISGNCWLWTGNKDRDGYGNFIYSKKRYRAHRLSFTIFVRPILPNKVICHTCDNPSCVNPAHLFEGTQKDNVLDMYAKGRWKQKRSHSVSDKRRKVIWATPDGNFNHIQEVVNHYKVYKDTAYNWFKKQKPGFFKIYR